MTSLAKDRFVFTLENARVEVVTRQVLTNGQVVDTSNGDLIDKKDDRLGQQLSRVTKLVTTEKSGSQRLGY